MSEFGGYPTSFLSFASFILGYQDMTLLSYILLWTRIFSLLVCKIYQGNLFWELDQDIIDHVFLSDQDGLVFACLDILIFLVL